MIIVFLNKRWEDEWQGSNELWDESLKRCIQRTDVKFNRAVVFQTNDISYHGVPEIIRCPEDMYRQSLAYYYVSPKTTTVIKPHYREKAHFVQTLHEKEEEEEEEEEIQLLRDIRNRRLITEKDLREIMPEWKM